METPFYTIDVTPDAEFNLTTSEKDTQTATVNQDKTSWTVHDFDADANGTITAEGITAGKWMGSFNFDIKFNGTDGENVNSEEYIEYQTIKYPEGTVEPLNND